MRTFSFVALACFSLWACCATCGEQTHDEQAGTPLLQTLDPDKHLPGTAITLVLDTPHVKDANLLYCATGQLGWNEFIRQMKGPIDMVDAPAYLPALNRQEFDKTQIDAASTLVFSGQGPDALGQLRAALIEKFGAAASPKLIPENLDERDGIIYTYLFKNLEFKTPLYPFPFARSFRTAPVKWFGIGVETKGRLPMLGTLKIHDYVSDDDFVVEIRTKNADDVLLIAELPPKKTFKETVDAVLARQSKATRAMLDDGDSFMMPSMNFEITKQFPELMKKLIRNAPMRGGELEDVTQLIRFKLDERGALLKSEARLRTRPGEASPDGEEPRPTRHFICDRAFLVLMLQKGQTKPYFALWVENDELLVKVKDAPVVPRTRSSEAEPD